jgi:predicted phosphodiesterase
MQKIIFITDVHISGKNPICRTDDLTTEQFKKLSTIIDISNKKDIPIINSGDLTDSPNISYSTYTKLANVLKESKRGFYTLYGNHDLQFHTMDTSTSVALGALIESVPSVKHISEFEKDYGAIFDYEDWDNNKEIVKNGLRTKILVCHRAIVSNKLMNKSWMKASETDFYNINERGVGKYGMILCGHFHKQYEIIKDSIVLNPGCFTRRNANEIEVHVPSYYIIDIDNLDYELHSLPNVKGTNEVISYSHLTYTKMAKNIKTEIAEFFKKIKFNKEKNQFKINMLKTFNNLEEGSLKEIMREVLQDVYGNRIEGVGLNEITEFSRLKRYGLR